MAEQYIVSARKYRPQTFDTVIGQEHITTTLKNAIRHQHLAHAYLFCGPRGVGKTTCARILAKTINCENPTADMEACGVCGNCQSFSTSTSFNIFELDAASNNSVDDIRELTNQVRFAPQQGKYKVYIIDEVHMLSAAAFNAFLKTLEEPPPYAIFILATTEKHKILPTILSRCQIFDFKRIVTEDIVNHLHSIATREGMIAQESALHVIAQKSEGAMRDALSMLDRIAGFTNGQLTYAATMEHLNMLDADFYFGLTDYLLAQDISGTLLQLDAVLEKGFEGDVILTGLAEHFRNLLLCKDQRMAKLLDVPNDHKPIYFDKANQAPPSFILSALNVLHEAELNYKNANNKRLHIEMCLIRLCYVLQATDAGVKKNFSTELKPHTANKTVLPKTGSAETLQAYTVPEAPTQQVREPGNTISKTPVAEVIVTPVAPKPVQRVTKRLMDDIDEAVKTMAASTSEQKKELSETYVQELYDEFKEHLKTNNKSVYHAQFSLMKAELAGADEIKIIAPNDFMAAYVQEVRDEMIEMFRKKTGLLVRVTTEVRVELQPEGFPPQILSKQEIYELMSKENPNIAKLKEQLGLQLDY